MKTVQLRDAKATLSKLVDEAADGEPTIITRHGRPDAVLVPFSKAAELYPELEKQPASHDAGNFGALLLSFPGGVEFERDEASALREVDLG